MAALRAQQVNTKFGAVLPRDQIAHKTGELGGTSHDVGWFFSGQRWLAVAVLTSTTGGNDQAAGNDIIKAVAKKVSCSGSGGSYSCQVEARPCR